MCKNEKCNQHCHHCEIEKIREKENIFEKLIISLPKYNYRLAKYILDENGNKLYVEKLIESDRELDNFKVLRDLNNYPIKIIAKKETNHSNYYMVDVTLNYSYEALTNIIIYNKDNNKFKFIYKGDIIQDSFENIYEVIHKNILYDVKNKKLFYLNNLTSMQLVNIKTKILKDDIKDLIILQKMYIFNGTVIDHINSKLSYKEKVKKEKLDNKTFNILEENLKKSLNQEKSKDIHIVVNLSDKDKYLFINKEIYSNFCELLKKDEFFYLYMINNINNIYFDKFKSKNFIDEKITALDMGKILSIIKLIVMGKSELGLEILNEMNSIPRNEFIHIIKYNLRFFKKIKDKKI